MTSTSIVQVAVGVLINSSGEVLIAKRADHLHQGGLWEFPGGKVEDNEDALSALQREFKEEVDIVILSAQLYLAIHHDYGDKQVTLDVWRSNHFSGMARGLEGQPVAWVPLSDLPKYPFPKANQPIIEKLLAATTEEPALNA